MWSVGCIIAELFTKKVFINADSDSTYIKSLITILGMPSEHIQSCIGKRKVVRYMKKVKDMVKPRTLKDLIPDAPAEAIDLISKLLTYDPLERLTAKQVLQHPFLEKLYDP